MKISCICTVYTLDPSSLPLTNYEHKEDVEHVYDNCQPSVSLDKYLEDQRKHKQPHSKLHSIRTG